MGDQMEEQIEEALGVLGRKKEPEVRIVKQCFKNDAVCSHDCPFIDYCWKGIPTPSVYDLSLTEKKLAALLDEGIMKLRDVPAGVIPKSKQKFYRSVLTGKAQAERKALAEWLDRLEYPLYFLDYETYGSAIPRYDGYKPYQAVPFQYSLHVIERPGAKTQHFEHLETEDTDPVPALAKALKGQIGTKGTVLVWNMGFEKSRNKEMGKRLPAEAQFLEAVNARVIDLMETVRKGLYVHPDFVGSASIKAVLPVLCPELSYEGLVTEDGAACDDWPKLVGILGDPMTPAERSTMKKRMLDYCGMDTFAMVRILEEMRKVAH
jgi:hypothetical protein